MAVGWVLRKKAHEPAATPAALETERSSPDAGNGHYCCQKSTLRWIVTLVLSLQLLAFVLVSVLHGRHHGPKLPLPLEAPIMFMFKLQRSASLIQSFKSELESNLSSRIHASNMKVSLYSVNQQPGCEWAEVRFQLLPDPSNSSSLSFDNIRGSLVKLFLQPSFSLTPKTFGRVYDFQINKLPGGITIIPEPSHLRRRASLFNFTLHNGTISSVSKQFTEFKRQLATGLSLRHNEMLVTRLTNKNGSTIEPPVIVQTSVFKSVGHHLPPLRLKQLAQHVSRHRKNLGLNHTMFGKVRDLQLSSVLQRSLGHEHAPSPSPAHAPGPAPAQHLDYTYGPGHSPRTYGPGNSPRWYFPALQTPSPAPVYAIETGFAKGPGVNAAPDTTTQHQGIASVPTPSPSSSAGSSLHRLWTAMLLNPVLMASVVFFLLL